MQETQNLPSTQSANGVEEAIALAPIPPSTDVFETDSSFVLTADMPGVDPATLEVSLEDGVLKVKGEAPAFELEGFESSAPRRYARTFRIRDEIDEASIEAGFQHGVLRLTLPKAQKVLRTIPIQVQTES